MSEMIYTVSELTAEIKITLEEHFSALNVIGEISNFKAHVSGHWYFTLKDGNAQISCTMWRGINNYVFFTPQDGMKVIVRGRLTVYPPRGSYQLDVRSMQPAGEGELQAAFERLKRKLQKEGLFDQDLKKTIPSFPQKIGIVTGSGTAALRDMISVAKRRYPIVELLIAEARVQGEGAAEEISQAIKKLNKLKDIDLIIVARGGGSLEDLWAFNEEIVARAIFESKIPVVSGVGHEIDFTIADFVADYRAPTPSAAMEIATPDINEIFAFLNEFSYNTTINIFDKINSYKSNVQQISGSYGFRNPFNRIKNFYQYLDNLAYKLDGLTTNKLKHLNNILNLKNQIIHSHSVEKNLKKGYSLIRQNGKLIPRASQLNKDKDFTVKFFDEEVKINRNA